VGPSRADALRRLFLEDRKALLRYVRRLMGGRHESEDIVQEALLRAYEHSAQLLEPRAFAFTAARNLAADSRRHQRLAKTDTRGDFGDVAIVTPEGSPEGDLVAEEERQLLREGIEQLAPQCRTALRLKVFHHYSYKDIAQQMGISPKTVENHIARAVRETHEYVRRRYKLTATHYIDK